MQPTDLQAHPEGGRFQEVFRSSDVVTTSQGKSRSALTHIYFSLKTGEVSRFHRVESDEVWNLYQGQGVRLHLWDGTNQPPRSIELSSEANCFCTVVPAGVWQAAEPIGASALVGCSVGPGFEFEDFTLIESDSSEAKQLLGFSESFSAFI